MFNEKRQGRLVWSTDSREKSRPFQVSGTLQVFYLKMHMCKKIRFRVSEKMSAHNMPGNLGKKPKPPVSHPIMAKLNRFDTLGKSFYSFLVQQIYLLVVLLTTACLEKTVNKLNKTEPVT